MAGSTTVVRDTFLEYARRGVFRGFDHRETEEGAEFRFYWLGPRPFHVRFTRERDTLTVDRLLPAIREDSPVLTDLEQLLRERAEGDLPPHRMVDPGRAEVELVRQQDDHLGLVLRVVDGHHEYGVRKLLNLVNEIWVRLQDAHQRYLWEAFDAPME